MEKKEIDNYISRLFDNKYQIYQNSFKDKEDNFFFMVKNNHKKYLVVGGLPENVKALNFKVEEQELVDSNEKYLFQICPLTNYNLTQLQSIFNYLQPSTTKMKPSFGTGDRLGIVWPSNP